MDTINDSNLENIELSDEVVQQYLSSMSLDDIKELAKSKRTQIKTEIEITKAKKLTNYGFGSKIIPKNIIVDAIDKTNTVSGACRYLKISRATFKKWALFYSTPENNLYQSAKVTARPWQRMPRIDKYCKTKLKDIFEGRHPNINLSQLKNKLVVNNILPPVCSCCGWSDTRQDGSMPLMIDFIDGNNKNFSQDNLRFVCYNCHYIHVGPFFGRRRKKK